MLKNKVVPLDLASGEEDAPSSGQEQSGSRASGRERANKIVGRRYFPSFYTSEPTTSPAASLQKINIQDIESSEAGQRSLCDYLIQMSENDSTEMDFDHVEQLIQETSDINVKMSNGQYLMHEIASKWDANVARFWMEKGADIECTDNNHRTPLHLSAIVGHSEMVQFLIKNGANIEALTLEEHTPMHYAVRGDSVDCMKLLIDNGGNYEARDYRGRTPLHLAADMVQIEALWLTFYCLFHHQQSAVTDYHGNMCLVSMVTRMPSVAHGAMDQLYKLLPKFRTQEYFLFDLEREPQAGDVASVFDAVVFRQKLDILQHPCLVKLLDIKWKKLVRWQFYTYFLIYLVFVLFWTVLIAYHSIQEKYIYKFPQDIWRIVCEIIALVTYFFLICDDVVEFLMLKKFNKEQARSEAKMIMLDMTNLCLTDGERKYLQNQQERINKLSLKYLSFFWIPNASDLVIYFILIALILLHIFDILLHTTTLAVWTARVACVAVVSIWARILKYLRVMEYFAATITILSQILTRDAVKFGVVFSVVFVPYGVQAEQTSDSDDLTTFYRVMVMIFRIQVVDDYPYSVNYFNSYDSAFSTLLLCFLVIVPVIGLNVFIAQLSDTFQRIYDNAEANALMEKAKVMLFLEKKTSTKGRRAFYEYLRSKCNPLTTLGNDENITSHLKDKESSEELMGKLGKLEDMIQELLKQNLKNKYNTK